MWWILGPDGMVAPMKDKRVREALNLAIDRAEIAQAIFAGKADPAAIPLGLSWSFRDIGLKVTPEMSYPYDPVRAKKLLADAGQAGGFPLDVYAYQLPGLPEGKAFAEAVAGYWEKIGIKTKLIPVDYPAFRKNWVDRKTPGSVGYFNIANRDWIGTFALLEKQAYTPSKPTDTVNDPEVDAHDGAGHAADGQGQGRRSHAQHLPADSERAPRCPRRVPALGLCHLEDAAQVDGRHRDVRPLHRPARRVEVEIG